MGWLGLKTSAQKKKKRIKKKIVNAPGHSFDPYLMKLARNNYLYEI